MSKRAKFTGGYQNIRQGSLKMNLTTTLSVEIRSFCCLGENETLKPAIDSLVDALNRLQTREVQLELAADFCDLFLQRQTSMVPFLRWCTYQWLGY